MKKILFAILVLILGFNNGIKAQEQNDSDKLTAYKIAFLTKKLDLTSVEAEKFWPVYNVYSAHKNKIQLERITTMRYVNQNESNMTDQELAIISAKLSQTYIDESNLTIIFAAEVQKVLPPGKIIKLYQAEAQYKLQLLKELNDRRQQGGGRQFKQRLN
jgi:hypothetical protein